MPAKLDAQNAARQAIRLIGKGDLRGAAAAMRSGPSARPKLGAEARADLEKIARRLERLLQGKVSASDRRVMLALRRAVQKWLASATTKRTATAPRAGSPKTKLRAKVQSPPKVATRPRKKEQAVARTKTTEAAERREVAGVPNIRNFRRSKSPTWPDGAPS